MQQKIAITVAPRYYEMTNIHMARKLYSLHSHADFALIMIVIKEEYDRQMEPTICIHCLPGAKKHLLQHQQWIPPQFSLHHCGFGTVPQQSLLQLSWSHGTGLGHALPCGHGGTDGQLAAALVADGAAGAIELLS